MTDTTDTKSTTSTQAITSTRQKDPKRVEAGRRLGQISKQIREQRMRERIESELKPGSWSYAGYLVGLVGLGLAALSVYYARAQYNADSIADEGPDSIPDANKGPGNDDGVKITKKPAAKVKLDTLDTLG